MKTKAERNLDRADSARNILTHFCESGESDGGIETLSIDLMCNIKHLLTSEGIDWLSVLNTVDGHFDAETAAEEVSDESYH